MSILLNHDQQKDCDYKTATHILNTKSLFKCPLCKEDFHDPRILCSNGHTFCLNCIRSILPDDGALQCPNCKEEKNIRDIEQLPKNFTVQTLKLTEYHRNGQIACFKCMNEHEQSITYEQTKEYIELVKIRDNLNERLSEWDKQITELKDVIRRQIQIDAEKQIKEIEDREQSLYNQLDGFYQTHLKAKNIKLQKLKLDIEKESQALEKINPKCWSLSDRVRLSQYWTNLQRKLDDQSVNFIYKTSSSSLNRNYLGELYLKPSNEENESLQHHKSNTFHHQNSLILYNYPITRDHLIKTEPSSKRHFTQSSKIHNKKDNENLKTQMHRIHYQQSISNEIEQVLENNTPLTPRMPIAPIHLENYNKKATQILIGLNEADKFLAPKAIAITDTNHLLIADTKKHRIIIYDLILKNMRAIKGFLFPDGLCLAKEQYVIVTDRHRVSKYDWLHGKMISFIGSQKEGCTRSSFSWPKGVTMDNTYVYVCDSFNSRIVVLTHRMRYENEWLVMKDAKKLDPQYIAISNHLLYVTAWQRIKTESCAYNAGCIMVYNTDGTLHRYIDIDNQTHLNLSVPEGIVCDSLNQLILADRFTSRISSINNDNPKSIVHFYGDKMKAPHYVCFSNSQNTMIVTDIGNNTVQFYGKNDLNV